MTVIGVENGKLVPRDSLTEGTDYFKYTGSCCTAKVVTGYCFIGDQTRVECIYANGNTNLILSSCSPSLLTSSDYMDLFSIVIVDDSQDPNNINVMMKYMLENELIATYPDYIKSECKQAFITSVENTMRRIRELYVDLTNMYRSVIHITGVPIYVFGEPKMKSSKSAK